METTTIKGIKESINQLIKEIAEKQEILNQLIDQYQSLNGNEFCDDEQ